MRSTVDFNRLEWLQFILWVMAVTVKLALYLYALVRLLGGQNKAEDSAPGWIGFLCIRAASGFCARCCASSI